MSLHKCAENNSFQEEKKKKKMKMKMKMKMMKMKMTITLLQVILIRRVIMEAIEKVK